MTHTVRTCVLLFAALLLSLPSSAKSRKEIREEARLDSIRVADSLRAREAKRVADSLNLLTYAAYSQKAAAQKEQERLARENPDTTHAVVLPGESDVDIFERREIVVPPGCPQERIVDSLDMEVSAVEAALYGDRDFKKAKSYTVEGKIRYLKSLLKSGVRRSPEIVDLTEKLLLIHTMQRQKLAAILQTQEGNNRAFLMLHIKKIDADAKPVSDYLAQLMMTESATVQR